MGNISPQPIRVKIEKNEGENGENNKSSKEYENPEDGHVYGPAAFTLFPGSAKEEDIENQNLKNTRPPSRNASLHQKEKNRHSLPCPHCETRRYKPTRQMMDVATNRI